MRVAAQLGVDAGDELQRTERLGHVIVGTEVQSGDLVDLVVARRQHDDRPAVGFADLAAQMEAVHVGQHDVQHGQVDGDVAVGDRFERTRRIIADPGLIALGLKVDGDQIGDLLLVVHDQYGPLAAVTAHGILLALVAGLPPNPTECSAPGGDIDRRRVKKGLRNGRGGATFEREKIQPSVSGWQSACGSTMLGEARRASRPRCHRC